MNCIQCGKDLGKKPTRKTCNSICLSKHRSNSSRISNARNPQTRPHDILFSPKRHKLTPQQEQEDKEIESILRDY